MSAGQSPQDRLALSRERLHLAMRTPPKPPINPTSSLGWRWLEALQSEPGIRVVMEALRLWWEQYPLRTVATQVAQSASAALTPMAQRNPLGLMLVALVAGGLLTLARPWRWISLPAIFAGVLPQILVKLVTQVPPSTWLERLDALLRHGSEPQDTAQK
jgi:hypothetical protein